MAVDSRSIGVVGSTFPEGWRTMVVESNTVLVRLLLLDLSYQLWRNWNEGIEDGLAMGMLKHWLLQPMEEETIW